MANPTTGFYSEAKRLTHPRTTISQFIEKHKLQAEIIGFSVNREFPNRPGNHYVIHIKDRKNNSTGFWMTDNQAPNLERFLAALQRECRWVAASIDKRGRDNLENLLIDFGFVQSIQEAAPVAQMMRDNVGGFRWVFGSQMIGELVNEVIA